MWICLTPSDCNCKWTCKEGSSSTWTRFCYTKHGNLPVSQYKGKVLSIGQMWSVASCGWVSALSFCRLICATCSRFPAKTHTPVVSVENYFHFCSSFTCKVAGWPKVDGWILLSTGFLSHLSDQLCIFFFFLWLTDAGTWLHWLSQKVTLHFSSFFNFF